MKDVNADVVSLFCSPLQYKCLRCDVFNTGWFPYCCHCGAAMATEKELVAAERVHPDPSKRTRTFDCDEINEELSAFKGYAAKFWGFFVSHATAEIHLYKTGGTRAVFFAFWVDEVWINTGAWKCSLSLRPFSSRGDFWELVDDERGVLLRCGTPMLFMGGDSPFSGDGICPR